MKALVHTTLDSAAQAWQQLVANRMRTLLSLLGVTIGIFCIISVFSAVDSLERDIRSSFEKLGKDVLYISKMPWTEDPNANYHKYLRRPNPSMNDFRAIESRVQDVDLISFSSFIGVMTVKHGSNAVNGAFLIAVTRDYAAMYDLKFESGRYFSDFEMNHGGDKVVIGHSVAENLFGRREAVGQSVHIGGRRAQVVGVIEKSGESLLNTMNYDWAILVSYQMGKKFANLDSPHMNANSVNVKAKAGMDLSRFRDEVTLALRVGRGLKPVEKDNFSINELSVLVGILDQFFSVLNLIGLVIGGFALLVGAFSVANIMFVSVKERVSQIGIKKALGAKRSVILLEFLIESVFLCLIGGAGGLLLVFLVMKILTAQVEHFEFVLSTGNILIGFLISSLIGILSGILPAWSAARMDPVRAIRS